MVPMATRFLTLAEVGEILAISPRQARTLVATGELKALQIGGRGMWRVEQAELDAYIQAMYAETDERIRSRRLDEAVELDEAEEFAE